MLEKSERFNIRLSPAERAALEDAARRSGKTMSELIRQAIEALTNVTTPPTAQAQA